MAAPAVASGSVAVKRYTGDLYQIDAGGLRTALDWEYPQSVVSLASRGIQPISSMLALPDEFDERRWPEASEAFARCKESAMDWAFWRWPDQKDKRAILARVRIEHPEFKDLGELERELKAFMDADRQANAHRKNLLAVSVEAEKLAGEACLDAWVRDRDFHLREFHYLLGFPADLPDPTLPDRTWLLSWPEMRSITNDDGAVVNSVETYVALVVGPPGLELKEHEQYSVCKAEDLKLEDQGHDYQSITVKAMPVKLSPKQSEAWGRSMHWKGRVFHVVSPSGEKPKRYSKRK